MPPRINPVLVGVTRGVLRPGATQFAYLNCLLLQAAALFIWWPKNELGQSLASEQGPQPLLAVLVALGLSLAYYSLRAGAEEFLLEGQQSLHEWTAGTALAPGRVLRGAVCGHWLQVLYALLLSAPLIGLAFTVGSGTWTAVSLSVAAIFVQTTFYWLAGVLVYLGIGQHGQATFFTLRVLLLGGYVVGLATAPSLSHLMISAELLGNDSLAVETYLGITGYVEFLLFYAVAAAILSVAVQLALRRLRKKADGEGRTSRG